MLKQIEKAEETARVMVLGIGPELEMLRQQLRKQHPDWSESRIRGECWKAMYQIVLKTA